MSYAVNLVLTGQRVLVVGGGAVAARKVTGLLEAGAVVTVVAPDAVPELADDPDVRWHRREYRRGEAASYRLVFTATSDPAVNAQVARDGRAANVFVNSADDPSNCSFTLPAVVRRGNLQLAVSTNGRSPAFAAWLREQLEAAYTDAHARLLDLLGEVRSEARARFGTSELPGWADVIDDDLLAAVAAGRDDEARARVRTALGLAHVAQHVAHEAAP
ncbi:MAG TPA: bifunctional precorrin-2 dehydrogenase/sirohydrochlorin ferrochelatase [Ilumatobacter sp.]|nr:bifunctional precorrin-2 dehydrogenase/sirohydrochlorin ferrochelatase [Ilumatobacter sp.]